MKFRRDMLMAYKFMKAKFFSRRTPLMVSWFLTYRCNKRCIYCDSWKIKTEELDTKKILNIIDEMAEAGTKLLHFTGGDPLLKDDIGLIIEHCKQKKIITNINSNPVSIFKKIEELENVNLLTLSFDGPEEIHDLIRGRGSFRILMAAVKVIKQSKKKLRFITVLSKYNLNTISYILKKAQELNVPVVFQPARKCTLTGTETNPIAPTEKDYKKVILGLIIEKKRNKYIINSIPGLRHLYNWPSSTKIKCINSFIICRLQPNGDMYGCGSNLNSNMNVPNCLKLGFKKSFKDLIPINCETCWCASFVELNHLFSLNIKTMLNVLKLHVTNSLL